MYRGAIWLCEVRWIEGYGAKAAARVSFFVRQPDSTSDDLKSLEPQMTIPVGSLSTNDEKARTTFRRLLLAKQLFLHGIDHSEKAGSLNKMIAIHNLHNAVEIVLRAIFLHFEIRPEKELNIGFENMLAEIDRYSDFKSQDIKLPYRQEMRNLNKYATLFNITLPSLLLVQSRNQEYLCAAS